MSGASVRLPLAEVEVLVVEPLECPGHLPRRIAPHPTVEGKTLEECLRCHAAVVRSADGREQVSRRFAWRAGRLVVRS